MTRHSMTVSAAFSLFPGGLAAVTAERDVHTRDGRVAAQPGSRRLADVASHLDSWGYSPLATSIAATSRA